MVASHRHVVETTEQCSDRTLQLRKQLFGSTLQLKEMRVLVVEDKQECFEGHRNSIIEAGHIVIVTDDGYAARRMISQAMVARQYGSKTAKVDYDLVLVADLSTGITGPDVVELLRKSGYVGTSYQLG